MQTLNRSIDVKSVLVGILLATLLFVLMGQKVPMGGTVGNFQITGGLSPDRKVQTVWIVNTVTGVTGWWDQNNGGWHKVVGSQGTSWDEIKRQ